MTNQDILLSLRPDRGFFVGIDSDGCAFDTMEIKQKECFCPNFIRFWGFQPVATAARQTWEFVNLYSKHRGTNRFLAVIETIHLLAERKEVKARNFTMPDINALIEWVRNESRLGNPALAAYAEEVNDPEIDRALAWSKKVNEDISQIVFGIPPFPFVKESLERLQDYADLIVVSQTPGEALKREWEEHDIDRYAKIIAGQEFGTKSEHLKYAAKGKYPDTNILMIGDAPGDLKAARNNGVLFFPINPGSEELSWERFYNQGIDRFLGQNFIGDYQDKLIADFEKLLPEKPHWE
ncbi:MAG: HAD hydrolase-like protein [Bacteroidia bacterium]|nr:HAD hydrolase-like protein [Bacteroidia bacterium]